MLLMAVDISLVACKDSQPALTLISDVFSRYSPLHKSQNISPSDYRRYLEAVSYTHLTLPTIYSV